MINTLDGVGLARGLFATPISVIAFVMFVSLLLLLLRAILRNLWLAAAALIPLVVFFVSATSLASGIFAVLYSLPFVWVMIRFGTLPCILMTAVAEPTSG